MLQNKDRNTDLNGVSLRVIYLEFPGYMSLVKYRSTCSSRNLNRVPWKGLFPDIFETLASAMNFTYLLFPFRDGQWSSYDNRTSSWNGAVKDILDGFADMSASGLVISHIRSTAVDFSYPLVSSKSQFYVSRRPAFSWKIFYKPLHSMVWIIVFFMGTLLSVCLAFISNVGNESKKEEFQILKSITFICGTYSAVGMRRWSVDPLNTSAR